MEEAEYIELFINWSLELGVRTNKKKKTCIHLDQHFKQINENFEKDDNLKKCLVNLSSVQKLKNSIRF